MILLAVGTFLMTGTQTALAGNSSGEIVQQGDQITSEQGAETPVLSQFLKYVDMKTTFGLRLIRNWPAQIDEDLTF